MNARDPQPAPPTCAALIAQATAAIATNDPITAFTTLLALQNLIGPEETRRITDALLRQHLAVGGESDQAAPSS